MSTRRSPWAAGFICTSSLLLASLAPAGAAAAAKEEPPDRSPLRRELALARQPGLYLVLRPQAKALEIRARGMVLETVLLADAAVLHHRPWWGAGEAPEALPPAAWTVAEELEGTHRRVIAPPELKPLPDEEEELAAATGAAGSGPPEAQSGELAALPEPPDRYAIELAEGWRLVVGREVPAEGFVGRFGAAAADGWARLRGRWPERPSLLVLAVSPQEARRLHHLFRAGTVILLAAGPAAEPD